MGQPWMYMLTIIAPSFTHEYFIQESQHNSSFYQPGKGNILSFFAQGTLTPPPSNTFSFLFSSTKKSVADNSVFKANLFTSPASSVKSINLDSLPTPIPSRKSLAAYLEEQTPDKGPPESLLSPAGTPSAPPAPAGTTDTEPRATSRRPALSPSFVFAAAEEAAEPRGYRQAGSDAPGSQEKSRPKPPSQERFEQSELHRRLSKGQRERKERLEMFKSRKQEDTGRRASTGGVLDASMNTSLNSSILGSTHNTTLFSKAAARRRSLQLEEQQKKEREERRKNNQQQRRKKPDNKRLCNSARRPLRPLSLGSSNRRASLADASGVGRPGKDATRRISTGSTKENFSSAANVSGVGPVGKGPNALKSKKPAVTSNSLFTLNFSPPPRRVEDRQVYNYQEESSKRTFMKAGGRRSSMFSLEFSPPGKPGLTGRRKKRPSLEIEDEEDDDDTEEEEREEEEEQEAGVPEEKHVSPRLDGWHREGAKETGREPTPPETRITGAVVDFSASVQKDIDLEEGRGSLDADQLSSKASPSTPQGPEKQGDPAQEEQEQDQEKQKGGEDDLDGPRAQDDSFVVEIEGLHGTEGEAAAAEPSVGSSSPSHVEQPAHICEPIADKKEGGNSAMADVTAALNVASISSPSIAATSPPTAAPSASARSPTDGSKQTTALSSPLLSTATANMQTPQPPQNDLPTPGFSMGSAGKPRNNVSSSSRSTSKAHAEGRPIMELPPLPSTPSSAVKAPLAAPTSAASSVSSPSAFETSQHRTPIFGPLPPMSASRSRPSASSASAGRTNLLESQNKNKGSSCTKENTSSSKASQRSPSPISPTRAQLMATLDDLIAVEHEKRALADKLLEVDQRATSLQTALGKETAEVQKARAAVAAAQAVCTEKETMIAELRLRVEETKTKLTALEDLPEKVAEASYALATAQAQCAEKEAAKAALQARLESTQAQVAALEDFARKAQESAAGLAAAQAVCSEKERVVDALQGQLEDAKAHIARLETIPEKMAESQQALFTTQALCREKEMLVGHLREQLQEQRTRLEVLEKDLPAELVQSQTALATAQAMCGEKDRHVAELKERLATKEATLAELESMPTLLQQAKWDLEVVLRKSEEKDRALSEVQEQLKSLEASLAAAVQKEAAIEREKESLLQQSRASPTEGKEIVKVEVPVPCPETLQALEAAKAACCEKEEAVEELEERLAQAQARLAHLEKLPQEIERTREALATSEARCAQAGQLMDTLQEQLEEAVARVTGLEEEKTSLLAEQAKLQGQVDQVQAQAEQVMKEAAASAGASDASGQPSPAQVMLLEKLLVDRQAKADTDRARLEEEVEAQRVERRALEEALNMFFLAGGMRGLASKEMAASNARREEMMEARAEALRVLVEERRSAMGKIRDVQEEAKYALQMKDRAMASIQAELEEKEGHMVALKQQLVEEQEAIATLNAKLTHKEEEIQKWKKHTERTGHQEEEVQALMARVEKEEAEVCQLDGLIQEKENDLVNLQRALREKENEQRTLKAKVEEREKELEAMRQKWEAAEREGRNQRRVREEVERQVEQLTESLTGKEKECDSLRGRLAAQAEDRAALESLQDAQVQVKALTATLEKKNADMSALKERVLAAEEAGALAREEVAGQVEGLESTLQEKEHELNGLMDRLMAAQEYREEMQGKLARLTEEKDKAEAAAAKLKEEDRTKNEDVQRLLMDKEEVKAKLQRLEEEQQTAAAAVRQVEAEKEAVLAEAHSAQQYVLELEKKCSGLHQEIEKEAQEKSRLLSGNESLSAQVQEKEKELEALARKLVLAKDLAASLEEELNGKAKVLSRELVPESGQSQSLCRPQTRSATAAAKVVAASTDPPYPASNKFGDGRKDLDAQVAEQRRRMSSMVEEQRHTIEGHAAELAREKELREAMELHMLDARDAARALEADKIRLKEEMEEYKNRVMRLEKEKMDMSHSLGRMEEDCERADMVRKTLHNQLVELKGNIQVFVRVRPPLSESGEMRVKSLPFKFVDSGVGVGTAGERYCRALEVPVARMHEDDGFDMGMAEKKRFCYDQVFTPRTSQDAVFAEVLPLVQSALDGYKVCVFAYGQTGSGKTYTMLGPNGGRLSASSGHRRPSISSAMLHAERGIVYRSVEHVFGAVAALRKHGWRFGLSVEMVEIYNENLRDLLAPDVDEGGGGYCFESSGDGNGKGAFAASADRDWLGGSQATGKGKKRASKRLQVKHCFSASASNDAIPGLTSLPVHSASEVAVLVSEALGRRCVKRTRSNADSSRSHVVFTLKIEAESSRGIVRHGCLHMIDLAGSERMKKADSAAHPELLREAQSINKSLSALGNVMTALHKKEKHVPFRESALTSLLRHSLGGDCKALMVCNLSPSASSLPESLLSLRFAQKVNAVVTHRK